MEFHPFKRIWDEKESEIMLKHEYLLTTNSYGTVFLYLFVADTRNCTGTDCPSSSISSGAQGETGM